MQMRVNAILAEYHAGLTLLQRDVNAQLNARAGVFPARLPAGPTGLRGLC